ncbi:MAG: BamA/TamA family outer membrane protein [Balneolales bacterium]
MNFNIFLKLIIFLLFLLSGLVETYGQQDTRIQVWGLEIEGNEQYPDMVLKNIIATKAPGFIRRLYFWNKSGFEFSENEVRRDAIRIERYYQRRGYPHVKVTYQIEVGKKEWRRAVTFIVNEGPPTLIESQQYIIENNGDLLNELEANRHFRQLQESHSLREGQRYQLINHSEVEGNFSNTLRNLGYAFAKVEVNAEVDTLENSAEVSIQLNPGPITYFNDINISGTRSVDESYVVRESDIKLGDKFSQYKIRDAQRQIFSHHLFRFATITVPNQPVDSTVDININVRESELRTIRLRGGIGIEETIRGDISWQHRNPFGNANSFTTRVHASFIEQSASFDYLIPYIFNTHSSFTVSPFAQRLEEQNYMLLRGGITNSFLYQYNQDLAGSIVYELTRNEERFLEITDVVVEDQFYDLSSIQLSGFYGKTDIERQQGWSIRPYAEFSGVFGAGALNYQRFRLDIRRYFDFTEHFQLALRSEGGVLYTALREFELPSHIRYYLGGTNSVRGWTRRQLGPKLPTFEDGNFQNYIPAGGQSSLNFNIELRQDLRKLIRNFGIAAFLDGGQIWRESNGFNINELQYGIGGGVRYRSPVGPVRVDLGYKLNPTPQDLREFEGLEFGPPLNRWAVHFSIGQAF